MTERRLLQCEWVFLTIPGLIFVASGLFTFFDPHTMGEALGIAPMNMAGEVEIRATYGGLVVGSGLLMFAGVMHRIMAVAALAGVLFGAGGLMGTAGRNPPACFLWDTRA